MQFIYPTFLWALLALAIPIIIHLFYFRRFKRVLFTNVKFLKEVKEETSMRSRLRNLLVLALRLLALAFLVFAFAQPFIPQNQEVKTGAKSVSVFVDNSFSMSALSQDVPLLEKAKQRARDVVRAFNVEDRFQILSNDFAGRNQRLVGQEEALALIDEITIGPAVRNLSTVTARQQQALNTGQADNQAIYLISDFQRNITDLEDWQDSTVDLTLVPLQTVQERNVGLDSAWFEAPVPLLNQNNRLLVRIKNYSDEDLDNVRLSVRYNGQEKPEGVLSIPARSTLVDSVNINVNQPGWQDVTLSITDYPVQFDDQYHLSFRVAEKIKVLVLAPGTNNRFLRAALEGLGIFAADFRSSQAIDYSSLSTYQMIIMEGLPSISSGLSNELQAYAQQGGNLLVVPARNADLGSYRSFLTPFPANELREFDETPRTVGTINTEEFIFNDVFENRSASLRLPTTQGNFPLTSYGGRQEEALMSYRDGSTYLAKYRSGLGHLYLLASPIDEGANDLVQNAEIFVPMLYKMAISAGTARPLAYTIGEDEVVETIHQVNAGELVYKLRGSGEEFIPEQRIVGAKVFLGIDEQLSEAGFYELFLNEENPLDHFAFNYSRQESALDYYNADDLQAQVGDRVDLINTADDNAIATEIEERSQGIVLWRWCLILALIWLALEVLVLRFWKV
ncbi:BatA domain-containing protein [Lewinella cohaerens]|uniref:BatA domain-containing protein n=1 Tax=Lewinella cohaerens TaxID=70995 RepID=UPI000375DC66|nr:BatA domain-containing protein [Lewinella cohaerens]